MSSFVLVPGAGGVAWFWHRVVPLLEDAGHAAKAVDIREDDPALGLPEYADLVDAAVGDAMSDAPDGAGGIVLVGQSMGAFTVPVVALRRPIETIVLINPMIPVPGETPGEWWEATGQPAARLANDEAAGRDTDFDEATHFLHDVPADVLADASAEARVPAATPFGQPAEFGQWPQDVPIHVLLGRDDRFFPLEFARRLARDRLGVEADVIDGGHLLPLSNPQGVAERLLSWSDGRPGAQDPRRR